MRAVRSTDSRGDAWPSRRSEAHGAGVRYAPRPLADGRGRVPAGAARTGRRPTGGDAASARRGRHKLAGARRRPGADTARRRGSGGGRGGGRTVAQAALGRAANHRSHRQSRYDTGPYRKPFERLCRGRRAVVCERGQHRRTAGAPARRGAHRRNAPDGRGDRRVQRRLHPPLRAAPRDRASPPGRAHAGADGRARQPARYIVARGSRQAGRALRQPPARLRHAGSAGLPIRSSGDRRGRDSWLCAGGVYPSGCRGGGQRRQGGDGAGHPARGDGYGSGFRSAVRRGLRLGDSGRVLRVRAAGAATGPDTLAGVSG